MSFFQFQNPEYLLLLLLLPVLGWLAGRTGPEAAIRFSSIALAKEVSRARHSRPGRFLLGLRLLALAALIVALARPQMAKMHDTTDTEGIDIILTLDFSDSMAALDLSTRKKWVTRSDAVKKVVREFIDKRPYDRIGIVAFTNLVHSVSPLTLNHDWLKRNLKRLDIDAERLGSGTAIGDALATSADRMSTQEAKSRIVILLTDGDDKHSDILPQQAAQTAKALGIKVYTVSIGKQSLVKVARMTRDGKVIRDANGEPSPERFPGNSGYDEKTLREIADTTGGEFFSARKDGDLEEIYDRINELEKSKIELRSYATFTEHFLWPALIGLLLLGLEQLLSNTRYRRLP